MLKPNKLMTWEEMKKEYPAKWVFVEVVEGSRTNFSKGVVRAVVEDEYFTDGMEYCMSQEWDCTFKRTMVEPFGFTSGIVDGVNFRIDVEEMSEEEIEEAKKQMDSELVKYLESTT